MSIYDLKPEELPVAATIIALQLSLGLTTAQKIILGTFLQNIGSNLTFMAAQEAVLKDRVREASTSSDITDTATGAATAAAAGTPTF
ncbi:hypothetical protein [Clostridium sp. 'White wine YQ']|uniref:hypothetical protein n=1 Tax=Clostridium sp. 'White wine YQ' TaxID=3027474 RepID=UPI0023655339|nr:hypothetical protein [Clostridium sp. 'White wine YQ']MDD7796362.1 hypothetical protein [Clostridium sp. 'White wine YQ']